MTTAVQQKCRRNIISIHIPRVGDDLVRRSYFPRRFSISIHIPRVGDDLAVVAYIGKHRAFQSTSPVWGMTLCCRPRRSATGISIHIPRVGDDQRIVSPLPPYLISIHIPRVGDDRIRAGEELTAAEFQSTSPVWGMTQHMVYGSR